MTDRPVLGIVIPTLDEEDRLPRLLDDLTAIPVSHRVVVVDGGSTDSTVQRAEERGALVLPSPAGRARQMNLGARALDSEWLLFLHADSRLPADTGAELERWLHSGAAGDVGVFRFALEGDDWFWRFIEFGQRLRQRIYGLAYGDQGLLVRRERFAEVGGYPELPLMEDVAVLKLLKRDGRLRTIDAPLITSPRRYESDGRWFGWFRNVLSIGLFQLGVSAERLAGWYARRERELAPPSASGGSALLVFAKAPRPGMVKTRLARDVGAREAAEIYRRMGRGIVAAVSQGEYGITICFDPPDAEPEIREWLVDPSSVDGRLTYRPQARGDLGARLTEAVEQAFSRADRVCVIGTDTPDVDSAVVDAAFGALDSADCVLGPATDGGYYLIGLSRENRPELFSGIEWSTSGVMAQTLDRARSAGLVTKVLEPLSDVDVVEDLPAGLRG